MRGRTINNSANTTEFLYGSIEICYTNTWNTLCCSVALSDRRCSSNCRTHRSKWHESSL